MYLSEETPVVIESSGMRVRAREPRWETIKLGFTPRLGLIVGPGDAVVFPSLRARRGDACTITVGPVSIERAHRPAFAVRWRFDSPAESRLRPRELVLFRSELDDVAHDEPWQSHRFSLERVADSAGSIVFVLARSRFIWRRVPEIALYELAASAESSLDLERARSFRSLRIRNEQANFDAYYQHAVFQPKSDRKPVAEGMPGGGVPPSPPDSPSSSSTVRGIATAQAPAAPTALEYSRARLAERMKLNPPPFGWLLRRRLDALPASRAPDDRSKLRVLSICSGAARIEADMVRGLPAQAVGLTLLDLNANLLEGARQNLASWGQVETIVADVNDMDLQGRKFDVVICVSALHHVVELEHVIRQVADALADAGEFWSIGETLGRNGGRMWPESYRIANDFFVAREDRYRRNRVTGIVDRSLPDLDYSIGCFEGIRSEAIEPTLLRFLTPVHVAKSNAIVHKLFSLAYSDNYDMALDEDRRLVDTAVDLDVGLHAQAQGRFDVELNGVYRRAG